MAKQELARHKQNEQADTKHRTRQPEPLPSPEHFLTPIGETPFRPSMDKHVNLLTSAGSGQHIASLSLQLQRTYGNRYVTQLIKKQVAQAKLNVSNPDDVSEREADNVAEKVVRTVNRQAAQRQPEEEEPLQGKLQRQAEEDEEEVQAKIQRQPEEEEELQGKLQRQPDEEEPLQGKLQRQAEEDEEEVQAKIQRQPEEEEELQGKLQRQPEEEEPLQGKLQRQAEEEEEEVQAKNILRRDIENNVPQIASGLEDKIDSARVGGSPMDDSILSPMQKAFGADFSRVKIHNDSNADNMSQSLQARAFTTGSDIFFKNGEYNPGSTEGQRLLAHELTHTIQQGSATLKPKGLVSRRVSGEFKQHLNDLLANGQKPETGTTGGKEKEEEKVEPPYKNKPLEGMDRVVYEQALVKFKQMGKSRIRGGLSKSMRRIKAMDYLNETVEASRKYTPHTQMIVNSIMQAYQDTFGEELTEEKAPETLGGKTKESKWERFKAFVTGVFKIKSWISWLKDFIGYCKDPLKAAGEHASTQLPQFLSFAQPVADQVSAWTQWLPIVGIVSSLFSIVLAIKGTVSKGKDMVSLRSTAKSAQKNKDAASSKLAEAAQYGYAKVRRGFFSQLGGLLKSVANLVLGVVKLVAGIASLGIGAVVAQAGELAVTLISLVATTFRKVKGLFKWILGTRGKARRENAEKIVMAAKEGSEDAMNLILKLDPSGIARGDKLDKFKYWLVNWGKTKKAEDKKNLTDILKGWNKEEINTLVEGVAGKLKSQ